MDKFSAFGVSDQGTSRMTLINPNTTSPYRDKDGNEAWIEIGHLDGPEGRDFDAKFERRAAAIKPEPGLSGNQLYLIQKAAALTKAWHLVGADGEVMDLPCTQENAAELYRNRWVYVQVIPHASTYANFSPASSQS